MYTWNFHPALIDSALGKGASGYLSKTLPARDLVTAIEAITDGAIVVSESLRIGGYDFGDRRQRPTAALAATGWARLAGKDRRPHRPRS